MPLKTEQYQKSLAQPPLCEQLKVRDLTDDLLIQLNGSFVAGYRVSGIHSYYASDDDRNRTKLVLEALIRSLPERSMRLQVRFEIAEGADDLIARYNREQQNPNAVLQAVDREQSDLWLKRNADGYYLQQMLHFYFIWDPRIHHQSPEVEWKKKMRGSSFSMSASKCTERSRREHEDLVAEFNSLMSGVEASLQATGMKIERLTQNDIFLEVKRAQSAAKRHPAVSSSERIAGLRECAKPDGERQHRGRTR
jgi:type IV secretory pathway VirB4 component